MILSDLRMLLGSQPTAALKLVFDDGDTVPASFHVTEVGHVTRRFIDCGRTRRTTECCLLEAAPRSAWVLWADGKLAEKAGDAAKARAAYEQLLAAYPEHQMGQQRLAVPWSAVTDADAKRALEYATKSRERFPDDPEVAKALGVVLFRQGNFNRAATLLGEAAQKREKDAEVQRYLGLALRQVKRPSDARKALETALALNLSGEAAEEVRRALEELKAAESRS